MLLISGLSGAGKSTVLHALEDAGFFCTDNLPVEMLHAWATTVRAREKPAAVCIDSRSCTSIEELHEVILATLQSGGDWQLIFVEANDTALQRRFSTLKRRHPFQPGKDLPLAIAEERQAMHTIRNLADLVLDSSSISPYQLAEKLDAFWRNSLNRQQRMHCTLISFSYNKGIPDHADTVIDVRFLPNPHYQPMLAPLDGRDPAVADFLQRQPEVRETENMLCAWLRFTWPLMLKERKHYFTLAFGCSGGRHRSVYFVERMASFLRQQGLGEPAIRHRELGVFVASPTDGDTT